MKTGELIWVVTALLVFALLFGNPYPLLMGLMIGAAYAVYLWTEPQRKAEEKAEKEAKEIVKAPQRIAEQRRNGRRCRTCKT
jgi:threonine/homoserine/homoserine lactone efflux protein